MYIFLRNIQGFIYNFLKITSLYTAVAAFVGAAVVNCVVGDIDD